MRLRSLGNGHSVCFIAPPEVHRSICDGSRKPVEKLDSADVLLWSMGQTCEALDVARPLRAMHGLEHVRQQSVFNSRVPASAPLEAITDDMDNLKLFWEDIQEDESQKLDQLYGIHNDRIGAFTRLLDRNSIDPTMQHLVQEYKFMKQSVLEDSTMSNEQERELTHEVERQRQVQRPPAVKPLVPKISAGLEIYVRTGLFRDLLKCEGFRAFEMYGRTTAGESAVGAGIDPDDFQIFVTEDFAYSVQLATSSSLDNYLRPISWILSSAKTEHLLILSPHEVNELLPKIKASMQVRLHTFAPKRSKRAVSFSDMNFYTPCASPMDGPCSDLAVRDLNLFAGSLYVDTQKGYERLCHFLGIVTASCRPGNQAVGRDGFIVSEARDMMDWPEECPFSSSPLHYFERILSLRMHGQSFSRSHMGALTYGKSLQASDFVDPVTLGTAMKTENTGHSLE
jgi:hypothetical protein